MHSGQCASTPCCSEDIPQSLPTSAGAILTFCCCKDSPLAAKPAEPSAPQSVSSLFTVTWPIRGRSWFLFNQANQRQRTTHRCRGGCFTRWHGLCLLCLFCKHQWLTDRSVWKYRELCRETNAQRWTCLPAKIGHGRKMTRGHPNIN